MVAAPDVQPGDDPQPVRIGERRQHGQKLVAVEGSDTGS
jgi:hypothetical protein